MSRGFGSLESFVISELGVRCAGPVLMLDLTADWAHLRRSLASPRRGLGERCDCPGACRLVTVSLAESVRQAVRRLEAKGVLRAELDWFGRKSVWLPGGPVTWRPGQGMAP